LLNTLRVRQGVANGASSGSIDEDEEDDGDEGDDDLDEGDDTSSQSDSNIGNGAGAPVRRTTAPTMVSTGSGGDADENTAEEAALVRAVADLRKSDEISADESSQILRLYATRDASIVGALESYMVDQNRIELRDTIRAIARESTSQATRRRNAATQVCWPFFRPFLSRRVVSSLTNIDYD
jgi:hypothetical protein